MQLFNKFQNKGFQFSLNVLAYLSSHPNISKSDANQMALDMGLEYADQVIAPLLQHDILVAHAGAYSLNTSFKNFTMPMSSFEIQYLQFILSHPLCSAFLGDDLQQYLMNGIPTGDALDSIQYYSSSQIHDMQDHISTTLPVLLRGAREQRLVKYVLNDNTRHQGVPWKLECTAYTQEWRVYIYDIHKKAMSRLPLMSMSAVSLHTPISITAEELQAAMERRLSPHPIVIKVTSERGALERCFLSFQHREFIETRQLDSNTYLLSFKYDYEEEGEILHRLLHLGSCVTLLEPPELKKQLISLIDQALSHCNIKTYPHTSSNTQN